MLGWVGFTQLMFAVVYQSCRTAGRFLLWGPICSLETPVNRYQHTLHDILEKRRL